MKVWQHLRHAAPWSSLHPLHSTLQWLERLNFSQQIEQSILFQSVWECTLGLSHKT